MIYYAKIQKQSDKSYLVEFPELEGCFTEGKNLADAKNQAKEALDAWIASNCDRNLNIPDPKERRSKTYYPIEVDIRITFPVMLRKARKKRRLSQTQVAKKLEISQQAYAKLETPQKANPSLLTIQKISEALELGFELRLGA